MKKAFIFASMLQACGKSTPPAPDAASPPAESSPITGSVFDATKPSDLSTSPGPADIPAKPPRAAQLEIPTGLPALPNVPEAVVARLVSGEEGCVGISKNGRAVASIVSVEGQKFLRITEHSSERGNLEVDGTAFTDPTTLPNAEGVAEELGELRLLPCQTTEVVEGRAVIPKTVPISIISNTKQSALGIDGNRPLTDFARTTDGKWLVRAAYWTHDEPNLFLRVVRIREHEADVIETSDFRLVFIRGIDLGQSACTPRPVEGKPRPTEPPPPFDPAPASPECVAMTADGKMAAFRVFFVDRTFPENSRPNTIEWHGLGIAPDIDLSCMARTCKAEDQTRLAARAAELGLTACARVSRSLVVGSLAAPFMYQDHQLKLKTTTGWRSVHAFADHLEGGGREAMWRMWQHPQGGPLFVYVGVEGSQVETVSVRVLGEEELGLCEAPPTDTLAAVPKVSSAAKPYQGLEFGGNQLVDGDPTTSWQPADASTTRTIDLELGGERTVTALDVWNGFQRRDGHGDLFALNARARTIRLTFSDGTTREVILDGETRGPQRIDLDSKQASSIRLEVVDVFEGGRWKDDLAISEIRVRGR